MYLTSHERTGCLLQLHQSPLAVARRAFLSPSVMFSTAQTTRHSGSAPSKMTRQSQSCKPPLMAVQPHGLGCRRPEPEFRAELSTQCPWILLDRNNSTFVLAFSPRNYFPYHSTVAQQHPYDTDHRNAHLRVLYTTLNCLLHGCPGERVGSA